MPTIRTTFEPDREVEVTDSELVDLRRQGLVVVDAAAPRPAAPKAKTSEEGK